MKRVLVMLALLVPLTWATVGLAADAVTKPDCTAKQTAYDEAVKAAKPPTPDLSSCKEKKAKEKTDCEKPIKDKAKEDAKAAKEKMKAAKKELDCCKNPKAKGCTA